MTIADIIIRPVVTEKASRLQEGNIYTFEVGKKASKIDIKNALKTIYGVEVENVKVMLQPKKTRLIGRGMPYVKRLVKKKAVVTFKDKKAVDIGKIKDLKKVK